MIISLPRIHFRIVSNPSLSTNLLVRVVELGTWVVPTNTLTRGLRYILEVNHPVSLNILMIAKIKRVKVRPLEKMHSRFWMKQGLIMNWLFKRDFISNGSN